MAVEIERKFLVQKPDWRPLIKGPGQHLLQGYMHFDLQKSIRLRLIEEAGKPNKAFICIKTAAAKGSFSRFEWEYEIPYNDAREMWTNVVEPGKRMLTKCRYRILSTGGLIWEIDEYTGLNHGLVTAEIELPSENTKIELPSWLGEEVTQDMRYSNLNLSVNPVGGP